MGQSSKTYKNRILLCQMFVLNDLISLTFSSIRPNIAESEAGFACARIHWVPHLASVSKVGTPHCIITFRRNNILNTIKAFGKQNIEHLSAHKYCMLSVSQHASWPMTDPRGEWPHLCARYIKISLELPKIADTLKMGHMLFLS